MATTITEFEQPVQKKGRDVFVGDVLLAAFGNRFEVHAVGELTTHGVKELVFRNETGSSVLITTPANRFDVVGSFEVTA